MKKRNHVREGDVRKGDGAIAFVGVVAPTNLNFCVRRVDRRQRCEDALVRAGGAHLQHHPFRPHEEEDEAAKSEETRRK